ACAALEEERALLKSAEQKEVAGLSKVGQERRKRKKAARQARQRRRNAGSTPESNDPRHPGGGGGGGGGGIVVDAAIATESTHAGNGEAEGEGEVLEQGSSATGDAAADGSGGGEDREGGAGAGGASVSGAGDGDGGRGTLDDQQQQQQQAQQGPEDEEAYYEADEEGGEEEEEEEEEKWYLMAGTWLSRWHAYVLSGTGEDMDFPTPSPGPITNGDIVDENLVPIPGKVAGKHYRGAMIEVWRYLHDRYGGGPVICRSDPDGLYETRTSKHGDSPPLP
ncbi:unnamed protein product, partial [Ectocarpus sp. 12 AP-2014]